MELDASLRRNQSAGCVDKVDKLDKVDGSGVASHGAQQRFRPLFFRVRAVRILCQPSVAKAGPVQSFYQIGAALH